MDIVLGVGAIFLVVYIGVYPWIKSRLINRPKVFCRFFLQGFKKENSAAIWQFRIELYNLSDTEAIIQNLHVKDTSSPEIFIEPINTRKLPYGKTIDLRGSFVKQNFVTSTPTLPKDFNLEFKLEYTGKNGKLYYTNTAISSDLLLSNSIV